MCHPPIIFAYCGGSCAEYGGLYANYGESCADFGGSCADCGGSCADCGESCSNCEGSCADCEGAGATTEGKGKMLFQLAFLLALYVEFKMFIFLLQCFTSKNVVLNCYLSLIVISFCTKLAIYLLEKLGANL